MRKVYGRHCISDMYFVSRQKLVASGHISQSDRNCRYQTRLGPRDSVWGTAAYGAANGS